MAAIRKLAIGLAGLLASLVLYISYNRHVRTPTLVPTDINDRALRDRSWFRQPGRVGQLDVYGADGLLYLQRDPNGRLVREVGFEQLWHQGADSWQVKTPFVRLFWQHADCLITADAGSLMLQGGSNRTLAKAGKLWGNVAIHIRPKGDSPIPDCQMLMDDLIMAEDRPLFSCDGTVRFTCPQGQWMGRQMELLYNHSTQRPQYLRIGRLDHLTWRIDQYQTSPTERIGGSDNTLPGKPDEYYQCLLRDQVLVSTDRNLIYASSHIHLTWLDWSNAKAQKGRSISAKRSQGPSEPGNVRVTCKGPVLICPMDLSLPSMDSQQSLVQGPDGLPHQVNQLYAFSILYDQRSGDIWARGPIRIKLYVPDIIDPCAGPGALLPLGITAADQATFKAETGELSLAGPCQCTLIHQKAGSITSYTLSSGRITAWLTEGPNSTNLTSIQKVMSLRADGGPVELRLESYPKGSRMQINQQQNNASGPLVYGAMMSCQQIAWDASGQVITAKGPGTIWLNNASAKIDPNSRQPFYAMVRQFATASYDVGKDRLIAMGSDRPILVDYLPVLAGRQDMHIRAQAETIQIDMVRDTSDRLELGSLKATGQVFYDDQENRFSGHRLTYDQQSGWMEILGTDGQPCSANGLAVSGIRFNLKTRQLQTTIVSPGMWLVR